MHVKSLKFKFYNSWNLQVGLEVHTSVSVADYTYYILATTQQKQ